MTCQQHTTDSDDDHECTRCGADRCPACGAWFDSYDAFLDHLEPT